MSEAGSEEERREREGVGKGRAWLGRGRGRGEGRKGEFIRGTYVISDVANTVVRKYL